MNRRAFFAALPAAPAAMVKRAEPERVLTAVYPICPACGLHALYEVFDHDARVSVPVRCGCGWRGESPRAR